VGAEGEKVWWWRGVKLLLLLLLLGALSFRRHLTS
jgi:hypothetical protein